VSLGKQAKTLTKGQIGLALSLIASTRYPARNRVILLLSVRAGLRAKEIAGLTWTMVTDGDGQVSQVIQLHDNASTPRHVFVPSRDFKLGKTLQEASRLHAGADGLSQQKRLAAASRVEAQCCTVRAEERG
jgi:integrase/recombinase XerD